MICGHGYFYLECVKVILGAFGAFSQNWLKLKNGTSHCERDEIWASEVYVEGICIQYFDVEHVKVILGSFDPHFSEFGH